MINSRRLAQPVAPRVSRMRSRKGLSVFEVMMAVIVFSLGMLGVYMMLVKSYELVTLCRHRDNARAVLLSYADQFQRLKTTDSSENLLFFFQTCATPTGFGLAWTDSNNNTTNVTTTTEDQAINGIKITLGDTASSSVLARVKRQVQPLNMSTGAVTGGAVYTAAGYMLQGTFTITYKVKDRNITQSLTVARSFR